MVYRRFGFLQSRLLLEKQDEMRKLEKRIDRADALVAKTDPENLKTRDLNEDVAAPRRALFKQAEEAFRDYASLLTAAQQLVSLNKPAMGDWRSIVNYIDDVKPQVLDERSWIRHREDLVTLRPGREHAWLDASIEHILKFLQTKLGAKRFVEVNYVHVSFAFAYTRFPAIYE
ncbi:MAG: hypothetical protein M1821_007753 [Bathelium mastoideum]|nr:MAG: hypothetical protein M1821_007753 [Bathelium mastoideum]